MGEKLQWVKIAESEKEIAFGLNSLTEIVANGRAICLGKYKEELFAFPVKCPHASGLFTDGFIDALGNVVCPLHRYKFCMKNGHNVSGEGYYLKHWPVENRKDGIYIGFESKSFWRLL